MIYVFTADDGSTIEVERPMTEAPDFGSTVKRGGKTYTRRLQRISPPMVRRDCHIESHSRPRWDPNHKGDFSPDGKPRFSSWSQVQRLCDATSDSKDTVLEYETW